MWSSMCQCVGKVIAVSPTCSSIDVCLGENLVGKGSVKNQKGKTKHATGGGKAPEGEEKKKKEKKQQQQDGGAGAAKALKTGTRYDVFTTSMRLI